MADNNNGYAHSQWQPADDDDPMIARIRKELRTLRDNLGTELRARESLERRLMAAFPAPPPKLTTNYHCQRNDAACKQRELGALIEYTKKLLDQLTPEQRAAITEHNNERHHPYLHKAQEWEERWAQAEKQLNKLTEESEKTHERRRAQEVFSEETEKSAAEVIQFYDEMITYRYGPRNQD